MRFRPMPKVAHRDSPRLRSSDRGLDRLIASLLPWIVNLAMNPMVRLMVLKVTRRKVHIGRVTDRPSVTNSERKARRVKAVVKKRTLPKSISLSKKASLHHASSIKPH
jgi:hypothetical protein